MRTSLLLAALATAAAPLAAQAPHARTTRGAVAGLRLASGVKAFRGVPFAAPPVGALRWRPPEPARAWTGVRDATRFADQCMQARVFSDMVFRNSGTSEDCLYLNVWQPADAAPGAKRPVLVYFYGGGFVGGDGSEPRYDGESMARQGIVVVTMSYRLGVFGFFAHPELTAESAHRASGNYALMDQAAALRWVHDNAAAFGGDPARVTIAGESAGSYSVSAQMASPLAKGLIAGAIGESGALFPSRGPLPTRADLEQQGVQFAKAVGAGSLSALRAMSAHELLAASQRSDVPRFGPAVDGWFFPESPAATFAAGRQAHVPLLAGWNTEEGSWRAFGQQEPTPESARAALQRTFGARADEALRVFPTATADEARASLTALSGDQFIGYSTWKWLDEHARTSGQPVWRYLYARPRPATAPGVTPAQPAGTGAVHSAEIEYAMGNLPLNGVFAWTPEDHAVSRTLQGYFANFIRTGNPNGAGLPEWPSGLVSGGEARRMVIDVTPRAEAEPRARYLFLDQVFTAPRP